MADVIDDARAAARRHVEGLVDACYGPAGLATAVKGEQLLIRDRGRLEEAIQLVPTPQAVVSEGIAETGPGILLDDELEHELDAVLVAQGLDADLRRAPAIGRARRPLRGISLDAALIVHEQGGSIDDARGWAGSLRRLRGRRPRPVLPNFSAPRRSYCSAAAPGPVIGTGSSKGAQ